MTGIQSLLAIGAILLFGLVSLRFNSSVIQNISLEVENKTYLDAFSLADDMIEEIKQKFFDEEIVDSFYTIYEYNLSDIGAETGENNRKLFDDIDDYNGFIDTLGLPYVENFKRTVSVSYADPVSFDGNYGSKTFYKRVDVTVESLEQYMSTPVVLSFIFSLHSK